MVITREPKIFCTTAISTPEVSSGLSVVQAFRNTSRRETGMKMAALNILSQPSPPTPSFSYCYNNTSFVNNGSRCKLHCLSYSQPHRFNVSSSLTTPSKPCPSPVPFTMPTRFSKSGNIPPFDYSVRL